MTRTSARRESPQPTEESTVASANMAAESRPSAENSEEVRRQLKKTSIEEEQSMSITTGIEDPNAATTVNGHHISTDSDARGRLRRKRSHEEVEGETSADPETKSQGKHPQKRSRSGEPEDPTVDKPSSSQDTVEDPSVPVLAASQAELNKPDITNGSLHARPETPNRREGEADEDKESLLISPKNKRTRDQFLQTGVASEASEQVEEGGNTASVEGSSKPTKRARDISSPQPGAVDETSPAETKGEAKIPPTSGFANTSATSPFASIASPKSPQTSGSAFASSGFSNFATAASPFAAAGSAAGGSASPFGALGGKPTLAPPASTESTTKPSLSPFGGSIGTNASSASPFATTGTSTLGGGTTSSGFGALGGGSTSGFGSLGGGSAFGSGFAGVKPAGGLSSFATPGAVGITGLSDKPAKPFGAAVDDDDDNDADDGDDDELNAEETESGIKSPPTTLTTEKKDKRFFEQNGKFAALLSSAYANTGK